MDRVLAASLIPLGQDTEMMGLFLFSDQCLLWLPLMVFTIMNEAGVSPRINVAVLDVYMVIALVLLCMTGSYAKARRQVNRGSVYSKTGLMNATADADTAVGAAEDTEMGTTDVVVDEEKEGPSIAPVDETIAEA